MKTKLATLLFVLLTGLLVGCNPTPPAATPATAATVTPPPASTATAVPSPTEPVISPSPTPAMSSSSTPVASVAHYSYRILNSYPHDSNAFTQGLVWHEDVFIEGTGLYGASDLRRVALENGAVLHEVDLSEQYFGEGLTVFEDRIIQITWQAQTGFVYDVASFELQETFSYPTEGWGITHDGQQLIVSDGTDTIYFWDPTTLATTDSIQVFDENGPVVRMNELEYIDGLIYANIWQTNRIAQIDPVTGRVVGWVDLTGLLTAEETAALSDPANAVLNGIAYDAANCRLFVTGKLWPKLFEIELVEANE